MRHLGLDLGTKSLGVAMSDPSGIIASAYATHFFADGDYEDAARFTLVLVKDFAIGAIILGHPRNMDGSIGFQAKLSEDFRALIQEKTAVPVILWDERLTTKMAASLMMKAKTKQKHKKEKVDQLAAAVLLQSYLDSKKGA